MSSVSSSGVGIYSCVIEKKDLEDTVNDLNKRGYTVISAEITDMKVTLFAQKVEIIKRRKEDE